MLSIFPEIGGIKELQFVAVIPVCDLESTALTKVTGTNLCALIYGTERRFNLIV